MATATRRFTKARSGSGGNAGDASPGLDGWNQLAALPSSSKECPHTLIQGLQRPRQAQGPQDDGAGACLPT